MKRDHDEGGPPLTLVNLTRYKICLIDEGGSVIDIPPSGRIAFVISPAPTRRRCQVLAGDHAPISIEILDQPSTPRCIFIPPQREGVAYIVSRRIAEALPARNDLLTPATSAGEGALRDENGNVLAIRRFKRFRPA